MIIAYILIVLGAGLGVAGIVCCGALLLRDPAARRFFGTINGSRRKRLIELRHLRYVRALDRREQALLTMLAIPNINEREKRVVRSHLFQVYLARAHHS